MDKVTDYNLKLLTGRPIRVEGFGEITPLKMEEIIDYDYSRYYNALNILTSITKESIRDTILKDVKDEELESISNLDLLIILSPDEIIEVIEDACVLFFKCCSAFVDRENYNIVLKYAEDDENITEEDFKIINRNNFDDIVWVLKIQNYVEKVEENSKEDDSNESDEVRRFKEKLKKSREQVEKAKKRRDGEDDDDSKVTLYDIISSLSTQSNVNELEVIKLTIYQVYTKFKRLEIVNKYDIDIQSMLAGAKDIKLKHWSTKIKD